jgi:hypothetical protein
MQHLENDMDDLFQRAAENYPLRIVESDWNKVAERLVIPVSEKEKKKSNYLFTVSFLLSSLIFAGLSLPLNKYEKRNTSENEFSVKEKNISIGSAKQYAGIKPIIIEREHVTPGNQKQGDVDIENSIKVILSRNTINGQGYGGNSHDRFPLDFIKEKSSLPNINESGISVDTYLQERLKNSEKIITVAKGSVPLTDAKGNINKKKYGFYWGIAAGPQLNEVRTQGMKKLGADIGLLAGYKLNRNLSVETGVFFSKKYYFSDGKYFDMSKMGSSMPPGMEIVSIEGSSSLLEIPIKLKYDFLQNNKRRIFSSAGISSYIMIRERNYYHALFNGTEENMSGSYKDMTHYAAAAINLSAGYEQRTGKQNSIRIEPYIQIPIRGIGVGTMPVTSAGLRIGILWDHK